MKGNEEKMFKSGIAKFATYGTVGLPAIPSEHKKLIDYSFKYYLGKTETARPLFKEVRGDSIDTSYIYHKLTQSYAEATGWTSLSAPDILPDGARPTPEGLGTEDATATFNTYAKGYRIDRKLLNTGKDYVRNFIMKHSELTAKRIAIDINATLYTNMASNAASSYAASATWATSGDPVEDLIDATNTFQKAAGGVEADFIALHPDNHADIKKDLRFMNADYTSAKMVETGKITPRPYGLDWISDTAVTKGTFLMGAKGKFGTVIVTEPYQVAETKEGVAGTVYEAVTTLGDAYELPYYLLAGSGI